MDRRAVVTFLLLALVVLPIAFAGPPASTTVTTMSGSSALGPAANYTDLACATCELGVVTAANATLARNLVAGTAQIPVVLANQSVTTGALTYSSATGGTLDLSGALTGVSADLSGHASAPTGYFPTLVSNGSITATTGTFTGAVTTGDPKGTPVAILYKIGTTAYARDAYGALLQSATACLTPSSSCDGDRALVQWAINYTDATLTGGCIQADGPWYIDGGLTTPANTTTRSCLRGQGAETTIFRETASNTTLFTFGYNSQFDVSDITCQEPSTNSGDCFAGGATNIYGPDRSRFERIAFVGGDSYHWAINFTNPFYIYVGNIRINQGCNGIHLIQDYSGNNFGNSLFADTNIVIDCTGAATAVKLETITGKLDLNRFIGLNVWDNHQSTGTIGLYIVNDSEYNSVYGANLENLDTGVWIQGKNNYVGQALVRATGTTNCAVYYDTASAKNTIEDMYINGISGQTNVCGFQDASTATGAQAYVQANAIARAHFSTPAFNTPRTYALGTFAYSVAGETSTTVTNMLNGNLVLNGTEKFTAAGALVNTTIGSTNTLNAPTIAANQDWGNHTLTDVSQLQIKNALGGGNPTLTASSSGDLLTVSGQSKWGGDVWPATNNTGRLGLPDHWWGALYTTDVRMLCAANDAQPCVEATSGGVKFGAGASSSVDVVEQRYKPATDVYLQLGGITAGANSVWIDVTTPGIVLKDTQGTPHYWRMTVSNAGATVWTDLGTSLT